MEQNLTCPKVGLQVGHTFDEELPKHLCIVLKSQNNIKNYLELKNTGLRKYLVNADVHVFRQIKARNASSQSQCISQYSDHACKDEIFTS